MNIMLHIKLYSIKQLNAASQERKCGMENRGIWLEIHTLNHMVRRYLVFSGHKGEIATATGNNEWIIGYLSKNADHDIYQKDLENHFTIARSTVSKVLRLMEQKGLILRESVPCDARLKKIVLTKKAKEINELMKEDAERVEQTLTAGFTKKEIETLDSYLNRMKENISGDMRGIS